MSKIQYRFESNLKFLLTTWNLDRLYHSFPANRNLNHPPLISELNNIVSNQTSCKGGIIRKTLNIHIELPQIQGTVYNIFEQRRTFGVKI
jgi:hypothetical protein